MSDVVETNIKTLESLLRRLVSASESILYASNGLSDNEWSVNGKTYKPMWPVGGYGKCLNKLNAAYSAAKDYFDPPEAERSQKWADACATASFIMDRFKEEMDRGRVHPNLTRSSLHRNIADAINGTLKQSAQARRAGKIPTTMTDKLDGLVESGALMPLPPPPKETK